MACAASLAATVAVLGLRLIFASRVEFCGGADACFYFGLARELAARHDFFVDFVWNYQVGHVMLPSMALDYWRPGTSLLLVLAEPFGGITLQSSAMIATVATGLAALSAAYLAWTIGRDPLVTVLGYLICLCLPSFWTLPLTPDSGLFYGAAVAWSLALLTGRSRGLAADLLGIACIGVAYLIRNDAILLGVPVAAVLAYRVAEQSRQGATRLEIRHSVRLLIAFVAALLPAHLLTYAVTGRLSNSSITQVIFFDGLADFSRYGSSVDFATWIAHGVVPLLKFRLFVLSQILHHLMSHYSEPVTLLALLGAGFALTRRGWRDYGWGLIGPIAFLLSLALFYVLVMPAIGHHAVLRSYTGFLPALAVMAAFGIRRITTSSRAAIALAAMLLCLSLVDGLGEARNLLNENRAVLAEYDREARIIEANSAEPSRPLVMIDNPAPFTVTTGIRSIPLPTNGAAAVRQAIRDFGVTHIVAGKWNGGLDLARELRASLVQDVPNTDRIVIALPANEAP